MKHFLIVVDMQKDFVDGSLGTPEAVEVVRQAAAWIGGFDGEIFATLDTHQADYLDTAEGRKLPVVHCVCGTEGWRLNAEVEKALAERGYTAVEKPTFGSMILPKLIKDRADGEAFSLEVLGLCTDICVVSNALLLKAAFPEAPISVPAGCCAGVTPEKHEAALAVMESCQIDVLR